MKPSCQLAAIFCSKLFPAGRVVPIQRLASGIAMSWVHQFWKRTVAVVNKIAIWSDRHLPRGVRAGLGVLAMAGGVVGFLPVLGFWMLPLGVVLIALDIPPLRRRVLKWLARQESD